MTGQSTPRRNWKTILAGAAVVVLAAGGFTVHRLAVAHVRYYAGADLDLIECSQCHLLAEGRNPIDRIAPARYKTPFALAVSPDGKRLYALCRDSQSIVEIDLQRVVSRVDPDAPPVIERAVKAEIALPGKPGGITVSRDGARAFVSLSESDQVAEVSLDDRQIRRFIPTGEGPSGMALSRDEDTLFVADWYSDDVSVIDLERGITARRLAAASSPNKAAATPDGSRILFSNQRSFVEPYPETPSSEVTAVDAANWRVAARYRFTNAHLLDGVAVTPNGHWALVALVRPKNLVPAIQVSQGWMMTSGLGVIDLATGDVSQVMLDEMDAYYADPAGVVVTPDGRRAFVSHAGVDKVSVVDLRKLADLLTGASPRQRAQFANRLDISQRYVMSRVAVGTNPKGMAVTLDGRYVCVAERLADRVSLIEARSARRVAAIDLGGSRRETIIRRGEKIFNTASATFQGQFSCRSCHPGDHVDRLQYDFEPDGLGRNIVDNRTLRGIRHTAPFKWNAKNRSLYMQCGVRFATFLTRSQPFSPTDLNALVAFIRSCENAPNRRAANGKLNAAQQRGKQLFERARTKDGKPIADKDRCITCHPPPYFTNRQLMDVGITSPTDSSSAFDTPQLNDVSSTAPYLHDGRARTLEEIWTIYNPDDKHGITSDFDKRDLNDLIEYLKTL